MKKEKQKKPKRSQVRHAALKPKYNSRILSEYMDYDYLDKLSVVDKDFLDKFSREYYKGSFEHDDRDLDNSPEAKKASYDSNNQRNRDLYGHLRNKPDRFNNQQLLSYESLANKSDAAKSLENELNRERNPRQMEEAYVDLIEDGEIKVMLEEYDAAMANFIEVLIDPE